MRGLRVLMNMLFVTFSVTAQMHLESAALVSAIENNIQLPKIPEFSINITTLGAKGDGVADNKPAFDKAMKACAKRQGGTVVVPEGTYKINGPIHFVSHVNLHLEEGATLVFGSNPDDYPLVLTSWEGTTLYNYSPLIYGIDLTDIAITGTGTIDGEGHLDWSLWKPLESKGKLLSRQMNHHRVPVEQRVFGEGFYLRPQLIQFVNSKNILIEDVTIEDAPFWCVHLLKSKSITLRRLKFDAHNKNNDGLDIEQSSAVLIENIDFNNADDNIAIKAGRDHDGRANADRPSEDIIIRNNRFKGLHALVIGSEMSAGVRNVFAYNNAASGYVKRGIYLKTNSDRGGYIKNIYIDHLTFGDVEDAIYITANYQGEGSGDFPSKISDIYISNLTVENVSNTAVVIEGYPNCKVENVTLDQLHIKSAKNGMTLTHTEAVKLNEVIIGEKQSVPSAVR